MRDTKVLENPAKPDHLLNCGSQGTNLGLGARLGNGGLLLGLSDNQIRPKKDTITSDRVLIIWTTGPCSIIASEYACS